MSDQIPPSEVKDITKNHQFSDPMASLTTIPDEIASLILQCIYDNPMTTGWDRDLTFANILKVVPHWIPILLDSRFLNANGQRGCRYEEFWSYRHLVYLDQKSGIWQIRDLVCEFRGANTLGWKCRNGDSSHVYGDHGDDSEDTMASDPEISSKGEDTAAKQLMGENKEQREQSSQALVHRGRKKAQQVDRTVSTT